MGDPKTAGAPSAARAAVVARRGALGRIFALAGGLIAGAAVMKPDAAGAAPTYMQLGALNNAGSGSTGLTSTAEALSVESTGTDGLALSAISASGAAMYVAARGTTGGPCMSVSSQYNTGEDCVSITNGPGRGTGLTLYSQSDGSGLSVERNSTVIAGAAIDAQSDDSGPVFRATSEPQCGEPLYVGTHKGFGAGMELTLQSTTSAAHVIDAAQHGVGPAIASAITNTKSAAASINATTNGTGTALYGSGGAHARGATLVSNVAQLRLVPGSLATHPASGAAGDLYVDNTNRLWFCKGTTNWHQVA
jgi:hypothetical protein